MKTVNCGFTDTFMLLIMVFKLSSFHLWRIIFYLSSFNLFLGGLYFIINNQVFIIEWVFVNIGSLIITFPLLLDRLGLLFSSVVLFISANVLIFSNYYIRSEVFKKRFLYLVLLFIISINLLIFIPHLIGLLLGWDGLGLVSFLLVIYYQNRKSQYFESNFFNRCKKHRIILR